MLSIDTIAEHSQDYHCSDLKRSSNGGDVSPTPTLHGQIPGLKSDELGEKDRIALPGQAYFGTAKNVGFGEKSAEYDEKTDNTVTRGTQTGQGFDVGNQTRRISKPGYAGVYGGAAPSGADAEEGLVAPRSYEEEIEREKERAKNGPDPWAVKFEPGERSNPKVSHGSIEANRFLTWSQNWSVPYRWYLTSIAGLLVLNSTFASSAPSGIVRDMQVAFGFSQEVAVLTIALFVAGYCVGPILWGPLSESYGRRPVFVSTFFVYMCMQIGCALSKNSASILVFRFLGGCFASAPLTNSGALIAARHSFLIGNLLIA